MAKVYTKVIVHCLDCPEFKEYFCVRLQRAVFGLTPPDKCPLPDEEVSDEKDIREGDNQL